MFVESHFNNSNNVEEKWDDRADFLSHAFFKKTCNHGDKDELRRKKKRKEAAAAATLPLNSIHWPNHLNQHHLYDDDDDVDEVNVCVCRVVWQHSQFCKTTNTHTAHMLVASCIHTCSVCTRTHTHARIESGLLAHLFLRFHSIPFDSFVRSYITHT